MRRSSAWVGVAIVAASVVVGTGPARADGPGVGTPTIVTLGDSYISGEAGRWAGNSNVSSSRVDALGSAAYYDNASGTGEQIAGCHRSRSAEVFISNATSTVKSINLACSGAKTTTSTSGDFKPGIDFYSDSQGRKGQAAMLRDVAATNNVKMVVLSIGGNDFNFASIVTSCVTDFLTSPSWWPNYCYDDSSVRANFTSTNISAVKARIVTALQNIRSAMSAYAPGSYTILVQTYPSPIPNSTGFRYSQSGYTRQSTGGCGFWNKDADWANNTALPTINSTVRAAVTASGVAGVLTMDLQSAFNGRRLCEKTVGLLEERGISSWTAPGAADVSEWIDQIRTVSTIGSPYYVQESLHPNYWAQQALQSCVRQAWNGGTPRGGACAIAGTGLVDGEPRMTLN